MAIQAVDIVDIIKTTLNELNSLKWTDISYDLQEYTFLPAILKKEKVTETSGSNIQWDIQTASNGSARGVGLYHVDNVNVTDTMQQAQIPWRHCTANYAFAEQEVAMNREPSKIVDLVKTRRHAAMVDLAKYMETAGWSKPTDSTDTTEPFGIPYWIVKNATTGFNGGNPSGFTSGAAGLDSATYSAWRNYTAQYASVTKADLIKKWRAAATKTNFQSPVDHNASLNRGDRYVYYTNYSALSDIEDIGESQNENLGRDVASMDGQIVFRKNPIKYVPKLDADTSNPVYGVNWGVFNPIFLKGFYMLEKGPFMAPEQSTVQRVTIYCTWNMKCVDRRRLFVLYV